MCALCKCSNVSILVILGRPLSRISMHEVDHLPGTSQKKILSVAYLPRGLRWLQKKQFAGQGKPWTMPCLASGTHAYGY